MCADGIDLVVENAAAAITQLNFLRRLIAHELPRKLFDEIDISLADRGQMIKEGTLVHAMIIEAPPPTKNPQKNRAPEVQQTKKGNEWCFDVKAHVGVDSDVGLVKSVVDTPTNLLDLLQVHTLLHGPEENTVGDSVCLRVDNRDKMKGAMGNSQVAKRGKIKAMQEDPLKELLVILERTNSQTRARVWVPLYVMKNLFCHRKLRYKGLTKNIARLCSACSCWRIW